MPRFKVGDKVTKYDDPYIYTVAEVAQDGTVWLRGYADGKVHEDHLELYRAPFTYWRCECGAEIAESPGHTYYCPKYQKF